MTSTFRGLSVLLAMVATLAAGGCQNSMPSREAMASISVQHVPWGLSVSSDYTVSLYSDGWVVYEGRANVKRRGIIRKKLPADTVAPLFAQLDTIHFWSLQDRYDMERTDRTSAGVEVSTIRLPPTDTPWRAVSVAHDGKQKRIERLSFAPPQLREWVDRVESTVDVSAWVGTFHEWPR